MLILLLFLPLVNCVKDQHSAQVDSDFAQLIFPSEMPREVYSGSVKVEQGSRDKPCQINSSCWQLLNDTDYSILQANVIDANGFIVLTPSSKTTSPTAIITKKKRGSYEPELPTNIGKKYVFEALTKETMYVLYDEPVQNTTVGGGIDISDVAVDINRYWLTVPYESAKYRGKNPILLTGHMVNDILRYEIISTSNATEKFNVYPGPHAFMKNLTLISFQDTSTSPPPPLSTLNPPSPSTSNPSSPSSSNQSSPSTSNSSFPTTSNACKCLPYIIYLFVIIADL